MKKSFQIPCSTKYLKDLRSFVIGVLQEIELDDTSQNAIVLAVDEVCANIIIHSECNEGQSIALSIELSDHLLVFEITDHGKHSFDINSYQGPDLDEIIETKRKGGVGILLVKKIMDRIEVKTTNGSNICRLYKSI
jgi:serine/threonine-protein kinase RsbW